MSRGERGAEPVMPSLPLSAISDELELLRNVYLEEMKILRSGSG